MKRVYQIVAVLFLCLSLFVILEARNLRYYSYLGPGPGFFPFWLGIIFAIVTLLWLVQVSASRVEPMPGDFVPNREGTLRIAGVVMILAFFTLTVNAIGFQLAMLVVLGFLLPALGRQSLPVTVAIALLGSFGLHYAFTVWLMAPLPGASIPFLKSLGL